jgi:hypothetical protein
MSLRKFSSLENILLKVSGRENAELNVGKIPVDYGCNQQWHLISLLELDPRVRLLPRLL